jgi:hypothetical protein
MKITILERDPHRDGWDNRILLILRRGRRKYRVCDGYWGGMEDGDLYLCDHHGWRFAQEPEEAEEDEREVLDFARAYLRLHPIPNN